jgi:hypothetical protein
MLLVLTLLIDVVAIADPIPGDEVAAAGATGVAANRAEKVRAELNRAAGARSGGLKGGSCHSFAPTTSVLLADGSQRMIGELKVGDIVLSTDPETGETTEKPVIALYKNQDSDLTDLTLRGNDGASVTLHTTQHHPFWSETRGSWVDADELQPAERLHTSSGDTMTVAGVSNFTGSQAMRGLTIADLHTY